MYSIGKFSLAARLSVKTLRHYHELGLLVPDHVDADTGYRYYRPAALERARLIVQLRDLGFALERIGEILSECSEDAELIQFLEERAATLDAELRAIKQRRETVQTLLEQARLTRMDGQPPDSPAVQLREVQPVLFCGLRAQDRWEAIGPYFGKVARRAGRHIAGPAMSLCHDGEYRETDASYEAGFVVRKEIPGAARHGLECRTLPGGRAVTLVHRGPYSELGRSYAELFIYMEEHGYGTQFQLPTRELYHKGPGLLFRGNPARYLTEIQLFLP